MARVLVADDEPGLRSFLVGALEMAGHHVREASDGLEAVAAVKKDAFDVLLCDLNMPGADGLSVLRSVREIQPDLQVIMMTAFGSVETAIQALKEGAFDYLQKPLSGPAELRLLVERATERRALQRSATLVARERADSGIHLSFGAPAMRDVVTAIERVALTSSTVLLLGESGTGKEMAARAVHQLSARRDNPYVAINCAAFSESLIESDLFGHEKGAFTGAVERRKGRLEMADTGTLFLDEVGELNPALQAKLLRVLEERAFQRIGGTQTIRVDVRLIAATNRDLPKQIAEGAFREDLYHRLAVFPVRLPPLRERREDIVPLAEVLLRRIGRDLGRPRLSLSSSASERLSAAPWQGNVRELRNVLERSAIMADSDVLELAELEAAPPAAPTGTTAIAPAPLLSLRELERRAIQQAMSVAAGNKKQAAELLGIGLRTLYDKLKANPDLADH